MANKAKFSVENGRRHFLKTIASAGLSSGLLKTSALATGMMLGRTAAAQSSNGINRVIFVYIPGGCPFQNGNSLFTPSSDLTLAPASATMESVKNECVFFSDASVSGGGGHGSTTKTLGGSVSRTTYDIALERVIGASSPFPSLQLGVQSTDGNHGYATMVDGRQVTYQDNPMATFNRVFGGNVSVTPIGSRRAQSVLDIQKDEIAELQSVLGASEKTRLDEHLASIEKIEERLQQQDSQNAQEACTSPIWNEEGYSHDTADKTRFTLESKLQVDLAVLAMRCNYTRVISFMFGNHQSEHAVPELNYSGAYHQSIHGGSTATYTETRAYLAGRLTYLIEQLRSATDDTGNSLLDSTLVVQVTDMADGNAHSTDNAPMLLAGGGSHIRRGQLASCGDHVNIFDTVTEAMGLTGQVEQYGSGALSGIIV